jgi:outer membrane autotransporter protein
MRVARAGTWVLALIVAASGFSGTARADDVDITTSTNSGINLDSFAGTTAKVFPGVTVSNSTFTLLCSSFPSVCATTHAWTLTNQGTIGPTAFGNGVFFKAGGSVVNSGSISGGNGIWIEGGSSGTVDNQSGASIQGNTGAIVLNIAGTATNAGTITSNGQAVGLNAGGTFTNLAGGLVQGHGDSNAVAVVLGSNRVVTNSGTIQSSDTGFATGVSLQNGTLTNNSGGQILGAYNGVWANGSSATAIANAGLIEASKAQGGGSAIEVDGGGTIVNSGIVRSSTSNATTTDAGIQFTGTGSITNSGTIQSLSGGRAILFTGAATHTLTLDTGSVLGGNVQGGSGTDNLVLKGTGSEAINKFASFETLSMQGADWTLTNSGTFATSTQVQSGVLRITGQLTTASITLTGGTLELAHATAGVIDAVSPATVTFNGGSLRSTVTGSLSNNLSFIGAGTISVASGQTATFTGSSVLENASALIRFGTASDTGTIQFNVFGGGGSTSFAGLEINGGKVVGSAGNFGLPFLTSVAATTTVAAGATLDFNDQMPNFNGIRSLLGAGNVVTGTSASTMLNIGDGNFAGVISGAGGIVRTTSFGITTSATDTLILTGANTYTGGTTINGGTLQLGAGGATGSIVGDVLNNGTLAFNRSDAVTFDGVISGNGAVQQNGGGSTNLTGTSTYTGATTVNAGTLFVNGSIAASSGVMVNAGATVGGTGTLPQTTINGGTLSPGNSIGTIKIAGNLSFVGAGNYLVEVAPGAGDRTNVTGSATLAGTLGAVGTGGSYTAGTRYTVLNATGGVTGTFGNLAISGSFGITRPHIEYDANNVYLVLDLNQISPFLTGGTRNQRAVAGAIDKTLAGGGQAAPFIALFGLTPAQLPAALDQLSGEVHASTLGVLADDSLYARSAMLGRLRQASFGGDSSMASLSTGGPLAFQNGEELGALAYGKSPLPTKAPAMASQPGYDVVFWAQGFGAYGKFNTDANAASVRRDLSGFFSGLDARAGTDGRIGIAAGYTGSRNNLDGRGSANVETGHLAAYGGWRLGALSLRAGGDYARHNIDTNRTIMFPGFFDTATARYQGATGQIFGEAGYGFAFGKVAVEPFAGAAWVHLHTDAFNERGGAAALAGAANSFEVGYSTLGIRAAGMIPVGMDMVLVPRGSLAWQHAFDDVLPLATVAFQATPVPFVIAGVPNARDSVLAEAGVDVAIGRSATVGLSYVGQLARNVQDHAAKGKFSWKF